MVETSNDDGEWTPDEWSPDDVVPAAGNATPEDIEELENLSRQFLATSESVGDQFIVKLPVIDVAFYKYSRDKVSQTRAYMRKTIALKHFLNVYSETGNLRYACETAQVSPTTIYNLREKDPAFAEMMQLARSVFSDAIESEFNDRVMNGVETPYVHVDGQDKHTMFIKKKSDRLLIKALETYKPETFKPKDNTSTGKNINIGVVVLPSRKGISEQDWENNAVNNQQRHKMINLTAEEIVDVTPENVQSVKENS